MVWENIDKFDEFSAIYQYAHSKNFHLRTTVTVNDLSVSCHLR